VRPDSVLVVGAGLAGTRCAETLRAEGFEGRIVLAGEEPIPPYERPALSKELLTGAREPDGLWLRADGFWEHNQIELLLQTRITRVDVRSRRALTSDGRTLGWDSLVLATGARPRTLPGHVPAGVHPLRTLAHALELRERLQPGTRLAVVGAGLIGGEVASSAASVGVDVVVVDRNEMPLERKLGREAGELLAERYAGAGIELLCGAGPAAFQTTPGGRLRGLLLEDGRTVSCDAAVVGIGADPAVPRGLFVNRLGIPADECGATAIPGVSACGDAALWWSPHRRRRAHAGHWTAASGQGATVARTVLGLLEPYDEPPYFWSDQLGLRLQCVGHAVDAEQTEVDLDGDSFSVRYLDRHGRLVAALLANRPRELATLRRELATA
jgi:3-phenylpropionate/trans-cinnamate dioxygenase ferredoxin reductase component